MGANTLPARRRSAPLHLARPLPLLLPLALLLLVVQPAASHHRAGRRPRLPAFVSEVGVPRALAELQFERWNRDPDANSIQNAIGNFHHESLYPRFAEPIPNVTVTVGGTAVMACVVDNLRGYKVAWVRVDTQTILSIHQHVITQNPRISLSHGDHRSWLLRVRDVHESDRGWYMCQLNTDPMRSRQGYLQVVVSPTLEEQSTPSEVVVRESQDVTLSCRARGHPEPAVTWRREDGGTIAYAGRHVPEVPSEELRLVSVSRLHTGAYLCIASNGVPPSASRRIVLRVQFPPLLSIPNQLEAAYLGQDVSLECHSEAYPASINYWANGRGDMILSGDKYEAVTVDSGYHKYMLLKIRAVSPQDFGAYRCIASNSLGEADGVIRLEEIPVPTTRSTTTVGYITLATEVRRKGLVGSGEAADAESRVLGVFGREEWRDSEYGDGAGGAADNLAQPSRGPRELGARSHSDSACLPPGALPALHAALALQLQLLLLR
ncbi:lachesin-like [Schistocerca piceifrons]|uniref:lachesin-like n=1 Tax=Schistocerca piceifrons TaxID=274613 RepID=UPI001F5E6491|nr:lachesin-like [Schistocerca piceifrons]